MRQFLAIVFLTIFTCQVLPLKVLGKLLNTSQGMEEVQDDAEDDCPEGKVFKFGTDDQVDQHYFFDVAANRRGFNNRLIVFIHKAEALPSVHIASMPSPPPDNLI